MTQNMFLKFQMKEQLTQARRDVAQSPKSAKTSLASQAVLRRVENERDEALLSCRNLTVERDGLRERLKVCRLLKTFLRRF